MPAVQPINKDTRYDIPGNLRLLAERIEGGEFPELLHVMVGIASKIQDGGRSVETFVAGPANVPEMNYTIDRMKLRVLHASD